MGTVLPRTRQDLDDCDDATPFLEDDPLECGEPARPVGLRSRKSLQITVEAIALVVCLTLVVEVLGCHALTVLFARLFSAIQGRARPAPTPIAGIGQYSSSAKQQTLSIDYEVVVNEESTWSAGSAFVGILVLQLSCVFQPAGSLLIDGAIGTWRFSPLYCLLDTAATISTVAWVALRYRCSVPNACSVVCAARYRSFRVRDTSLLDSGQYNRLFKSRDACIRQDIEDVCRISKKRRILATVMGLITVLQFAKIVSIQGGPRETIVTYLFGSIYFFYWLTHEMAAQLLRFSTIRSHSRLPTRSIAAPFVDASTVSLAVRSSWLTVGDTARLVVIWGGLLHYVATFALSMGVFGVGINDLQVHGQKAPDSVHVIFSILMLGLPLFTLYACLWPLIDFLEGFGWCTMPPFFSIWFTVQGVQVVLLLLLYYLCVFDSQQTWKAPWTEWLPR